MWAFGITCALAAVLMQATAVTWGGQHVELQADEKGAKLEFDCASGTIAAPLEPDADGRFSVRGRLLRQHAGPVRDDDAPAANATYSGVISGAEMTLRVRVDGEDRIDEYALRRGRRGVLTKCR